MNKINYQYRIAVAGMGNSLLGDDGLGVAAVRKLSRAKWPDDVILLTVGSSPFTYLKEISSTYYLIIIDAVRGDEPAGTIYYLDFEQIPGESNLAAEDQHGFSIFNLVHLSRQMFGLPADVALFGIEPLTIQPGACLSLPVKRSFPKLIDRITANVINYEVQL